MRYLIFPFIFQFVFCSLSFSEDLSLEQLQGEWINKAYLERLKATKSPREALDYIYYTSFTITKEKNYYKWAVLFNFHEGLCYTIIDLQPSPDYNTYHILFHTNQDAGRHSNND